MMIVAGVLESDIRLANKQVLALGNVMNSRCSFSLSVLILVLPQCLLIELIVRTK